MQVSPCVSVEIPRLGRDPGTTSLFQSALRSNKCGSTRLSFLVWYFLGTWLFQSVLVSSSTQPLLSLFSFAEVVHGQKTLLRRTHKTRILRTEYIRLRTLYSDRNAREAACSIHLSAATFTSRRVSHHLRFCSIISLGFLWESGLNSPRRKAG